MKRYLVFRTMLAGAIVFTGMGVLFALPAGATGSVASSTSTKPTSSSIVLGNTNTDVATVTGKSPHASPTGTVSFYECGPTAGPALCTSQANQVGSSVTLTPGASLKSTATSAAFTPTATGFWCFAGYYSGDSTYAVSSDTTPAECFDVTAAPTSTTTTPTSSSIVLGDTNSNTDAAVVTGNAAGGAPTGYVSFYECGPTGSPTSCTDTSEVVGTVALTQGAADTSSATSPPFTPTSTGYWCFAGYYSGDSNYSGSSDTTVDECFDVTPAPTSTSTTPGNSNIVLGNSDTDAATVTGTVGAIDPTGSVAFYECGPTAAAQPCTPSGSPFDTEALSGAANPATVTSAAFTPTSAGYWCFAGVYSGDSNYSGSSDTTVDECFDVTATGSSTMTTPGSSSIVLGTSNTDAATVTGSDATVDPTGSVAFYECGPTAAAQPCSPSGSPFDTETLSGTANPATVTSAAFTPTSTGYWCFAGVYSGNSNYYGSSDTTVDECFDVTATGSSTMTTPGSSNTVLGNSNTDAATVTGSVAAVDPTGSVAFYECGPRAAAQPCTPSGSPFDTEALSGATNPATVTSAAFTPTSAGYWCFAGVYSGDSNYNGSSDTTVDECFDVTVTGSSTTTTPTSSSVVFGHSETDRATVTGSDAAVDPTGSVAFYECGPTASAQPCTSASWTQFDTEALSGAGNPATVTSAAFTPTSAGYWCFAGVYSGDSNYNGSSDTTTDECFDVQGPVAIITASLPAATKGVPYSVPLSAQGGTTPYKWTKSGRLPKGLHLDKVTGVLSGTPTRSGTFTLTFKVTDSSHPRHEHATKSLTLVISP